MAAPEENVEFPEDNEPWNYPEEEEPEENNETIQRRINAERNATIAREAAIVVVYDFIIENYNVPLNDMDEDTKLHVTRTIPLRFIRRDLTDEAIRSELSADLAEFGVFPKVVRGGYRIMKSRSNKTRKAGLRALAKKHPYAKHVGFKWIAPGSRSRGIRWTQKNLATFRALQKQYQK